MNDKVYRVNIIIQEYQNKGFWNIFDFSEMCTNVKQIKESLENIIIKCREYIEKRLDLK